jgi:hypothetical protein
MSSLGTVSIKSRFKDETIFLNSFSCSYYAVRAAIRYHIDLRVNKQLEGFKGPVRLIRRTDDEIIADPSGSLTGNRGNFLLIDVIKQRYPGLLDNSVSERALQNWLSQSHAIGLLNVITLFYQFTD